MDVLEVPGVYDRVFGMADRLRQGLNQIFNEHRMGILTFGEGPMWHMLFTDTEPRNWRDILRTDVQRMNGFETELLRQGLFILPGNRRFISICHDEDDLALTFEAARRACRVFNQ